LKKILFIHHGEVPGGAPTSLATTLIEIKQQQPDWQLIVWCVNNSMKKYFENIEGVTVELISKPAKNLGKFLIWGGLFKTSNFFFSVLQDIRYSYGLMKLYKERILNLNPDIIHLNSSILFIPAWAAYSLKVKFIWHIREIIKVKKFSIRRLFLKWVYPKSDKIVLISESCFTNLNELLSLSEVIFNGVNIESFLKQSLNPHYRKDYSINRENVVLCHLGGINPRKGLADCIEIFNKLPENVSFLIAGPKIQSINNKISSKDKISWVIEDILIRLRIKEYRFLNYSKRVEYYFQMLNTNARDRIYFLGEISDVGTLLSESDILLFTATEPHFPRPVYEAWLMKKLVIAYDINGVNTEVKDGLNGILTYPNSSTLYLKINDYFNKKIITHDYFLLGYKQAVERFSIVRNTSEFIEIINSVSS